MLINTRETFYSADSEETDERCADSVFLQGSVAASSSPRLSLNLGHFRPPPSGTAQQPRVGRFVSPYSAWPHSQSCAGGGGGGLRRLAPAGARRGAVRHCAAEAQWRLVYHVRGEQKAWQSSAYNEVFSVMGRRESSCFPNHFPKKILTSGVYFMYLVWFLV